MKLVLTAALALAAATPAHAVLIDFEDQTNGANLASPVIYPEASFFSTTGRFLINGAGVSRDLCPFDGSCAGNLTVEFNGAASNISFNTIGENAPVGADIGDIQIFAGLTLLGTVNIIVDGVFTTKDLQTLTGFSGVTRLVLTQTDPAGITYDDFQFDLDGIVDTPAPTALALFGLGLAAIGLRRR